MRAIGVILQTKIFVDLQQPLLMHDRFGEIALPRIVAKQTRGRGLEPPIR